jgi:hypothetical protein
VAIASIIAKRSAAPIFAKNRSEKDTTEESMFGVRHQPPLLAVDLGQLPLAFAAFSHRYRMIIVIQRYFFKMETFAEI